MASHAQHVGGQLFKSKTALRAAVREVRDKYSVGETVSDPEDDALLRGLIERHPERDKKVGCGISHFTVEKHWDVSGSVGFSIARTDGSSIDFSFLTCVNGHAPTLRSRIHSAARTVVLDQILEFRAGRDGEVHHADPWPFVKIVDTWLDYMGIVPDLKDSRVSEQFASDAVAGSFARWHRDRAILVLLSQEDHRKIRR